MPKYIAIHQYLGNPDKIFKDFTNPENVNGIALANAANQLPAKAIFTWFPYYHGRTDYFGVCLWEADSPEKVRMALGDLLNSFTADIMEVDEVDWAKLAEQLAAEKVPA